MTPAKPQPARWGFVAAFVWEVALLLRRQQRVFRLGAGRYRFLWNGEPAVLAIGGSGIANAYRAAADLMRDFSPPAIVSIGFAGGLREDLRVGDLVLAETVIEESSGTLYACREALVPLRNAIRGIVLSTQAVVRTAERKHELANGWGALAVDMEAAGVARAAAERGAAFGAVKAITDAAGESLAIDFQRCQSDDGGLLSWKILRASMASRSGVRDLWRLAGGARRAAGRLALALASN